MLLSCVKTKPKVTNIPSQISCIVESGFVWWLSGSAVFALMPSVFFNIEIKQDRNSTVAGICSVLFTTALL